MFIVYNFWLLYYQLLSVDELVKRCQCYYVSMLDYECKGPIWRVCVCRHRDIIPNVLPVSASDWTLRTTCLQSCVLCAFCLRLASRGKSRVTQRSPSPVWLVTKRMQGILFAATLATGSRAIKRHASWLTQHLTPSWIRRTIWFSFASLASPFFSLFCFYYCSLFFYTSFLSL